MKIEKINILLILFTLLFQACGQDSNEVTYIDEDTFKVDEDNEKIKLAIKDAQDNITEFIQELNLHSKDSNYRFSIKTEFEGEEAIEHMWIEPLYFIENEFVGILINEPRQPLKVRAGDTVKIMKTKVEDWSISNDHENIQKGFFTEKYLFENE